MPSTARTPALELADEALDLDAVGEDRHGRIRASGIFEVSTFVSACHIWHEMPPRSRRTGAAAARPGRLFWRIFIAGQAAPLGVLSELGISPQQSMALSTLEPGEPLPMSALAGALHCDNSNVTGIVDRLEAAGLAERRPAERDRRVKTVVAHRAGEWLRTSCERRAGDAAAGARRLCRRGRGRRCATSSPRALTTALSPRQRARRLRRRTCAVGRISRASRFCSRMCADQPAVRAQVNSGVNSSRRDVARGRARPPTRTRRWWRARGPACGPAARRAPPSPAPRRPRRAASRSRARCGAGPAARGSSAR